MSKGFKRSHFNVLLFVFSISFLFGQMQEPDQLAQQAIRALRSGVEFYHSLAIEGGYVYHYTLDQSERWGEGKTDEFTIEVQPPGTPAVGMSFLQAYRATGDSLHLRAAVDAAHALIRGQNALGGWEHKIYFNRPKGNRISFDDDQSQSAISFLMALDQEVDDIYLTASIEQALQMMLDSQLESGGWPHMYPQQGNYHDFATFNDEGINDCIRVMIEAYRYYDLEEYHGSLEKAARFLMISQLPPPQPGWAQQYNEYLQPAWARSFEPPAVCPLVTINNINTLIDLYDVMKSAVILEPISDAIQYLYDSRLANGKWGRFLELGTNKPLYYDRGRIRKPSLDALSLERRTGYGYEVDLSDKLADVTHRFEDVLNRRELPKLNLEQLEKLVKEILDTQDAQGRWITKNDTFRAHEDVRSWDGEYRTEDRISSATFNRNVEILCRYLRLIKDKMNSLKGGGSH